MFDYTPEDKDKELFDLIVAKGLGEEAIKPPLYNKDIISKTDFSRKAFEKTGS